MELEEAIDNLTMLKYFIKTEGDENWQDYCNGIETVLNHLTKQEKMIELMAQALYDEDYEELICMEVDCDHITIQQEGKCIGKGCIKEYFENKANEE